MKATGDVGKITIITEWQEPMKMKGESKHGLERQQGVRKQKIEQQGDWSVQFGPGRKTKKASCPSPVTAAKRTFLSASRSAH